MSLQVVAMSTLAVVLEQPKPLSLRKLSLDEPRDEDEVVDVARSGNQVQQAKLCAVRKLVTDGRLSLHGLVTQPSDAGNTDAYDPTAVSDKRCLNMILERSNCP